MGWALDRRGGRYPASRVVTLAGGIAVAASIIAHGVQAIHERGQQLTASPYRLIYRLRQIPAESREGQ